MPEEVDVLEQRVKDELGALCDDPAKNNWGKRDWTRNVKEAVERAVTAAIPGCRWYGTKRGENQEWLWDGTARVEDNDRWVLKLPLVLESEWNSKDEVEQDFEKLMVARADLRLLVFDAYTRAEADSTICECIKAIRAYRDTRSGDRYLFACWTNDSESFHFRPYVA